MKAAVVNGPGQKPRLSFRKPDSMLTLMCFIFDGVNEFLEYLNVADLQSGFLLENVNYGIKTHVNRNSQ
jgi:hypothetical protein